MIGGRRPRSSGRWLLELALATSLVIGVLLPLFLEIRFHHRQRSRVVERLRGRLELDRLREELRFDRSDGRFRVHFLTGTATAVRGGSSDPFPTDPRGMGERLTWLPGPDVDWIVISFGGPGVREQMWVPRAAPDSLDGDG